MRLHARAPDAAAVEAAITAMASASHSYPDVGATRGPMPEGWQHSAIGGVVGHGQVDAERAIAALRRWDMFDLGWVVAYRTSALQLPGELFGFAARALGLWTVHVCRVVYDLDEDDGIVRRVGFAYGTLPGHALRGEEQFLVTWDRRTDEVTFTMRKFSRPNGALARVALPVVRRFQDRFGHDAVARIARAVTAGTSAPSDATRP